MKIAPGPSFPPGATCYVDLTGFLHHLACTPGPHGMNPQQITSKVSGQPTWGVVGTFNQLNTLAKQRRGRPLVVWRNGKAAWISPHETGALRETPNPYRT